MPNENIVKSLEICKSDIKELLECKLQMEEIIRGRLYNLLLIVDYILEETKNS